MAIMTKQQREEFLAGPHTGVICVGRPGLPPIAVPTFYAYEPGGKLTMFTNSQGRVARRTDAIRAAGVVTLVAQREEAPSAYVTVEATLDEIARPTHQQLMTIARRYMPAEEAEAWVKSEVDNPESTIIHLTFTPTRWYSVDNSDA